MLKKTLMTLGGAALLTGSLAWAAQSVTLVTDSGERISGQLTDMTGSAFVVMVNGEEKRYPISDIAVVDFVGGGQGLPDTEVSQVKTGEHLIILKNSESFHGQLFDFTGDPLKVVFKVSGNDREFAANEVGRIYLDRPAGHTAAAAPAPATPPADEKADPRTIRVDAKTQWTSTNVQVQKDAMISFATTGEVQLSNDAADMAGPAGSKKQRMAAGAPLPNALAGALIGRIGNGAPFAIGDQAGPIKMPGEGTLYLGINDDVLNDNQGHFNVVVTWHHQRPTQ